MKKNIALEARQGLSGVSKAFHCFCKHVYAFSSLKDFPTQALSRN